MVVLFIGTNRCSVWRFYRVGNCFEYPRLHHKQWTLISIICPCLLWNNSWFGYLCRLLLGSTGLMDKRSSGVLLPGKLSVLLGATASPEWLCCGGASPGKMALRGQTWDSVRLCTENRSWYVVCNLYNVHLPCTRLPLACSKSKTPSVIPV